MPSPLADTEVPRLTSDRSGDVPVEQTTVANLSSLIHVATARAVRVSGCSEVVFERHLREIYEQLLANAAESDRDAIAAILIEDYGYEPNAPAFQPGPGLCSFTGIPSECCPCGYHE